MMEQSIFFLCNSLETTHFPFHSSNDIILSVIHHPPTPTTHDFLSHITFVRLWCSSFKKFLITFHIRRRRTKSRSWVSCEYTCVNQPRFKFGHDSYICVCLWWIFSLTTKITRIIDERIAHKDAQEQIKRIHEL